MVVAQWVDSDQPNNPKLLHPSGLRILSAAGVGSTWATLLCVIVCNPPRSTVQVRFHRYVCSQSCSTRSSPFDPFEHVIENKNIYSLLAAETTTLVVEQAVSKKRLASATVTVHRFQSLRPFVELQGEQTHYTQLS